jgi:hypothetical protein
MATYKKLVINGQEADLPSDGVPVSFTLKISKDGGVSGSSSKRTVKLPSTKANDSIFEQWEKYNRENEEAPKEKSFYYEVNGLPILSGIAQLNSALLASAAYRRRASTYKIALYGNNVDWFGKIKDLYIKDLVFTPVVFDTPTVLAGFNASFAGGDEGGFFVWKLKEWISINEVDLSECSPFLFIKGIVQKAFAFAGYTIQSTFIDTHIFDSLILPLQIPEKYPQEYSEDFMNAAWQIDGTFSTPNGFVTMPPADITAIKLPPQNLGSWVPISSTYTVLKDGFLNLKTLLTLTASTGDLPQLSIVGFFHGGSGGGAFLPIAASGGLFSGSITVGDQNQLDGVIQVFAGDTFQFATNTIEQVGMGAGTATWVGQVEFIFEALIEFGDTLYIEYLLRDWKYKDLLNGLTDIYNLTFETDTDAKTVTIEPRNTYPIKNRALATSGILEGFYKSSNKDYTAKVDLSKEAEFTAVNDVEKIRLYKYNTDGSDDTANFIDQNQTLPSCAAQYNLDENRFDEEPIEKEVRFFVKTICTSDNEIQFDPLTGIIPLVPLAYPQNYFEDPTASENKQELEPRILHFFGQRGGIDGQIKVTGIGTPVDLPAAFFTNYNDTTGLDPNLSFSSENLQEGAVAAGILENYYLHENVQANEGKELTDYLRLNALDILNFSFREMPIIDDTEFIVQEINSYNPEGDASTKVILLKDRKPTAQDKDNIKNTLISSSINLVQ